MPLKKCYSSPHLSQLAKAAAKQTRKPAFEKPTHDDPAPKETVEDGPQTKTLKKCFSTPHLKDLNQLQADENSSAVQPNSQESSAFRRDEVINCRFRSCGCTVRLSRERMDLHLRTNAATHSLLILNKIDDLGRQNEQICKRLMGLENSMSQMMILFENLQDVLASKGIPSSSKADFPKGLGSELKTNSTLEPMQTSVMPDLTPKDTKMHLPKLEDVKPKRMPDHLDLAIASQRPSKRPRKSPPVPSHPMSAAQYSFSTAASMPRPPTFSTAGTMQFYSAASLSTLPSPNSLGITAMPQPLGLNSDSKLRGNQMPPHFTMMSSVRQAMENQPIDSASLRAQTKEAAKRVQDLMDSKGKMTKRKVRGRVKKGKNMFEAPKKPKTAYNYYQIGVRESILAEITADSANSSKEVQSQKVARIIGERWKNMPEHEREAFNTLALQDKQRYKRELEEYMQLKAQLKEACKAVNNSQHSAMIPNQQRLHQNQLMLGHAASQQALNMRVNYGINPQEVLGVGPPNGDSLG
uniref:HMG box domain-containing protein n=1 Tax=Lotharella globosa TaxID=91324 RepID=A0A7S4DWN0_9EUKA|mmetsp:Transcript_21795/g.43780  ORF Transcript_21795/g.43780 Transcript_21795/m.43780 type:complete len:523 (-) Transcript_21795:147-1715(-)